MKKYSKEMKKYSNTDKLHKIGFSTANLLAMVTIISEFFQLSAIIFNKDIIPWPTNDYAAVVIRFSVFYFTGWFTYSFWIALSCCVLFFVFSLIIQNARTLEFCLTTPFSDKLLLNFIPMCGTALLLPITKQLISAFTCVEGSHEIMLKVDNNIICFESAHTTYIIYSIIGLTIFIPTALLLRPYWQQVQVNLDIQYKSNFLIYYSYIIIIYVLLCAFITVQWIYVAISFIAIVILLILQITLQPCILEKVNLWKTTVLVCTMWTAICSVVALVLNNTANITPAILLYTGILVILLISYIIYRRKYKPIKISEKGTKMLQLAKNQSQPVQQPLPPEHPSIAESQ